MDIEGESKADRREYWREYQRNRYEQLKQKRSFARGVNPEQVAEYKETVCELGLTDHRHWRKRRKLKAKLVEPNRSAATLEFIYKRAKTSATARGIEFSIEPKHVTLVDRCSILGEPLEYGGLGSAESIHKPSLDRIDNSKGYVPGNVQIVSARANVLKRDATLEEMIKMGQWAAKQKRKEDSHQLSLDSHREKS